MKIDKELNRLSLHDSHFENELGIDDSIVLTFDWAKLDNLEELEIDDFVVLGKTIMIIKGIKDEQLKAYCEGEKYKLIDFQKMSVNIGMKLLIS